MYNWKYSVAKWDYKSSVKSSSYNVMYSRERLKTHKIYFAYFSPPIDMAAPVSI